MQVDIYRVTWHDFHPSPQNFSLKKFLTLFPKKLHSKKIIILSQKKFFLYFRKMELSSPNSKTFLIFSQKKLFLYFRK